MHENRRPDLPSAAPRQALTLRMRLTLTVVLVAALTTALVSLAGILTSQQALTDVVGENLHQRSADQAMIISEFIDRQVTALHVLSVSQSMVSSAEIANLQYSGSQAAIQAQLARQEQEWRDAPDDAAFVQSRISGTPLQVSLLWFQNLQPDNVQIALVDRRGGLIAANVRTAHFNMSGEAWWQAALAGETSLEQVQDPVSGEARLRIAVPVINLSSGTTVGVLQTTLLLDQLVIQLGAARVGESGGVLLQLDGARLLGQQTALRAADIAAVEALHASGEAYRIGDFAGRRRLISLTPISSSQAIADLHWDLIIYQDEAEALAPVSAARNVGVMVALGSLLLAGALAYLGAGLIARPLVHMAATAQAIAAGQLSQRVGIRRGDEIGTLARSFDLMADSLQQRIAAEHTAQQEQLRLQSEVIQVQADTLRQLATPFIPLGGRVLLLPLIGAIDGERADQIASELLREVSAHRARRVIIDVTGTPAIDATVAETLLRAATGVRLLGAEVVLTGIRAGLAQTLVELDMPLSQITIMANLDAALAAERV